MFRTYTGTVSVVAAQRNEFCLALNNGDELAVHAARRPPGVSVGEKLMVFGEIIGRDDSPPYPFEALDIRRK